MAPEICRKLLTHAVVCAVVRAFMKLGIAIEASSPMIATTIMISTSVKPARRELSTRPKQPGKRVFMAYL